MPLIVLGIVLLIVAAFLPGAAVLWTIGLILIGLGVLLIVLSYFGGAPAAGASSRYGRWGRWW